MMLTSFSGAGAVEPVDLVDPMIGAAADRGSCMPGPCLPHASIYPSPETLRPTPAGYAPGQPVVGFAQLHTQGTGGNPSYGNFLVTPGVGLALTDVERASPTTDETARAYAYDVRLTKGNVRAEVTPNRHSAIYRFTFPATDDAVISIDVARKVGGAIALDEGSVHIDPETGVVTGGGQFSKNWNPASYHVFFAAQVSGKRVGFGTWVGAMDQPNVGEARAQSKSLGAYFRFKARADEAIYLKIAVSFTSAERAQQLLGEEIPAWDFDAVRRTARAAWVGKLAAISAPGADEAEARRLYTALWHAFVQPRDRTGDLPGYDAKLPIWDDHYTLWDTWKTLFPLMAIIDPAMVRDNVLAFINRHQTNKDGYVAEAFIQGQEFKVGQGGNETDNVIADAFARKIPGVDWEKAYAILKAHADGPGRSRNYREKGWVGNDEKTDYSRRMKSGSGTLAFAYNDHNASQVAAGLGRKEDAKRLLARSQNWRNVWDDTLEAEGFTGFVRGRKLDGKFTTTKASEGWNTDFYEGICWEYSYDVPHDVPGLIEKMGGKETFIRRLNFSMQKGYIRFNNEPSFMTPWLFDRVQRPYLASHWADVLRRQFPGHDLPGDDDSGAMSSLYLFLTAGIFPIAGQDRFALHGARVPEFTFHLPSGGKFAILAHGAGPEAPYVQSAKLNGKALAEPWIRHSDIVAGGTLEFVMGDRPSAWGTVGEFNEKQAAIETAVREIPPPPAVH